MTNPNINPIRASRAVPEYKVTRKDSGAIVHPGEYVHDADGTAHVFRFATRPTTDAKSGKIIVDSPDWPGRELYAHIFGLTVSRVIPQHGTPGGVWCRFSGCDSVTGVCPVCAPDGGAPDA